MPRFQLLIREPGKPPRVVALDHPLVVGRSRRADVPIDDEEVGREQFRIGTEGDRVFVEGIGKTNRTVLDGAALAAGQRALAKSGAMIQVGRTQFELQVLPAAPVPPPAAAAAAADATMVAPRPPAAPGGAELPPEERTGGYNGPMLTMELRRPGEPPPPRTPSTESLAPPRPGQPTGGAGGDGGVTMTPRAGYRPGQPLPSEDPGLTIPPPGRHPPKPPTEDLGGMTIPVAPGYRPGRAEPPPRPAPAAPPAAAPVPPTPPPRPTPPPPAPAPVGGAAAAASGARPKTVLMDPGSLPAPGSGAELEARLHQTLPRLFLKSDALKRRLRLMKVHNRIGRAESSDVLLPHDSVSELHAEIRFDGTRWLLRDAGSTNGTVVDGTLLRGEERPIGRHTLLGFGSLRAIFLCNGAGSSASDRRLEERAVHRLVKNGRLGRDTARQALQMARSDQSQSLAELLLMETPVEPVDWSAAIGEARRSGGWLARLLGLFSGRRKPPPPLQ